MEYPPRLDALVPDYLARVPEPAVGSGSWSYSVDRDGLACELAVYSRHDAGSWRALFYPHWLRLRSDAEGWELADPGSGV